MIHPSLISVAEKVNQYLAALKAGVNCEVAMNRLDRQFKNPMESLLFEYAARQIAAERIGDDKEADFYGNKFEIVRFSLLTAKKVFA